MEQHTTQDSSKWQGMSREEYEEHHNVDYGEPDRDGAAPELSSYYSGYNYSDYSTRHRATTTALHRDIERRMLTSGPDYYSGRYNRSFLNYMVDFSARKPDMMLFTANSAIPLADSVRGWMQAMDEPVPELMHIKANTALGSLRKHTESKGIDVEAEITKEIERLRPIVDGARVVVFDQYVATGSSLELARRMLGRAGAICLGATDDAQWYQQAYDVDLERMTSRHARFMRGIGRRAAEAYLGDE